jgi:hypothetical protein
MAQFQHLLKLVRIELGADAGDFFAGVKVEMNLTKA